MEKISTDAFPLTIHSLQKSKKLYAFLELEILEDHWDLKCSSVVILLFLEVEPPEVQPAAQWCRGHELL